jgi:predicted dehydrogenase
MNQTTNRRDFLKKTALASAGVMAWSASSYARIIGANERINFAVLGLNGRGQALIKGISKVKDTAIPIICDVDSKVLNKVKELTTQSTGLSPSLLGDYRKVFADKSIDAVAIATPDHWHTPMAIAALQAGKHVYVEKPLSHNPLEGEILVQAWKKSGKIAQMGNQQRSAPTSIQAIKDIQAGIIGEVNFAKCWYANKRGGIGIGKKVAVPEWLDWELWQGPAPRREYFDNRVHYNWHWFWHWGTGEICNNGTHEIDICRWALGVDFPTKVSSIGGRFHFKDDWEFYDTQVANFEFANGKMLTWESKSSNNFSYFNRGRGVTLHGTKGTILLDRNDYIVYDLDNKVVKEVKEEHSSATTNTVGEGALDVYHFQNFANAIRQGEKLNAPLDEAHKSVLLCHLGNIAQKVGTTLITDPKNGHILQNKTAQKMWGREYEKGWEVKAH